MKSCSAKSCRIKRKPFTNSPKSWVTSEKNTDTQKRNTSKQISPRFLILSKSYFKHIFTLFFYFHFFFFYHSFINRDKATVSQMKLKELMDVHQNKEASLQDKLHNTQKELKTAVDMHAGRTAFGSVLYICTSSAFPQFIFCFVFQKWF